MAELLHQIKFSTLRSLRLNGQRICGTEEVGASFACSVQIGSFYVLLSHSAICPQLGGRAPVASSAVVMGPASQESTDVTVCRTAQMDLTRETAVSLLQGGFPFFFLSPVAF